MNDDRIKLSKIIVKKKSFKNNLSQLHCNRRSHQIIIHNPGAIIRDVKKQTISRFCIKGKNRRRTI